MPFDNLNNVQTRKLNLGLLILFTFLAMLATVFLPFMGFVTWQFSGPTVLLVLSNRFKRWHYLCNYRYYCFFLFWIIHLQ